VVALWVLVPLVLRVLVPLVLRVLVPLPVVRADNHST
jgi:hypothetical protein